MRRQLLPALGMLVVFTIITGALYPLLVTGAAQAVFKDKANGSLITNADGTIIGSKWIGQPFSAPKYLHPRPAADAYVPGAQGGGTYAYGSNYGPLDPRLVKEVRERVSAYRTENGLNENTKVPVDAVTASGSGLDPHISVANARLQAPRVAKERGLAIATVRHLVDRYTAGRALGVLGEPGVNVLQVNLALDRLS
jgi:K+-transporting ATPase ATPase C chain